MSASDADGLRGCGRGEASSTAPQPDRAADLRGWSLPLRTGLLQLARRVIARQAPWTMEQRKRAILILVHPNPHLHIVLPMPALRDLKLKARVAHRVVPPDDPILLNTKDARQVAHKRHERVPRLRRLDRKARVVLGHIDFGQVAVGVRHVINPGQAQHLRQAALERAEHPLHPAPALRAVGRDVLDAELLQSPTDLGQLILVDRLAGLGREEIVTAPIGVERTEQALARDHLAKATQAREGAFRALGVIAVTQTAEMALADAEQFRGLHAAQLTPVIAPDRIDNPGHSYLRQHAIPPALNRTDRVLPNPDISRATDSTLSKPQCSSQAVCGLRQPY